jgi:tryptophan synthase alpha chain
VSRIEERFTQLRRQGRTGLVTYVTAGDPDLQQSAEIIKRLDQAGADVLEIGVPFSDPLADGPVIQRATERALAAGVTLAHVLKMLRTIRPSLPPSSSLAMPIRYSGWAWTDLSVKPLPPVWTAC